MTERRRREFSSLGNAMVLGILCHVITVEGGGEEGDDVFYQSPYSALKRAPSPPPPPPPLPPPFPVMMPTVIIIIIIRRRRRRRKNGEEEEEGRTVLRTHFANTLSSLSTPHIARSFPINLTFFRVNSLLGLVCCAFLGDSYKLESSLQYVNLLESECPDSSGPHRQVPFPVRVRYRRATPTFAFFSLSLNPDTSILRLTW